MKYILTNKKTNESHYCDKVTINGFDYYIWDDESYYVYSPKNGKMMEELIRYKSQEYKEIVRIFGNKGHRFVLATNNPNDDIPKVIDEIELQSINLLKDKWSHLYVFGHPSKPYPLNYKSDLDNITKGYNKALETHPYTESDMHDFIKFCIQNIACKEEGRYLASWELLKLWNEQKTITIYYE